MMLGGWGGVGKHWGLSGPLGGAPVVVEPVDDGAGLEVELRGELLDGFGGRVWLLLVGPLQCLLLLRGQHHTRLLELVLGLGAGALAIVDAHGWGLARLTVTHGAVPPLHVGWGRDGQTERKASDEVTPVLGSSSFPDLP